jgi:hypothetical protein
MGDNRSRIQTDIHDIIHPVVLSKVVVRECVTESASS